tara:strand:+ start:489 stop:728 length:240 start_codon:yes stop_codon:yes gene_type:complete
MFSVRQQGFIQQAANVAMRSNMLHKHGCVAVASGKIVGRGYNIYRSMSSDGFISNCCSCHAEISAIRNCSKQYNKVVHR